ncbi:MAG TPA: GNAT family N-acetyltransferase, partial [Longimicrobiales bacterium]|nr:GNAT family N-acetyltransferase [Longimicrobiales bacterium]
FEEQRSPVSPAYADRLLASAEFYAIAAMADGRIVGGLTAHVIPMTRNESRELFIYDLAVVPDWRRKGVGSGLIGKARELAAREGIDVAFVMADGDDDDAIEFYGSTPATASRAVVFTFDELQSRQVRHETG